MSKLQFRGSIAGAAIMIALFSSSSADAQVSESSPTGQPDDLYTRVITGVQYEIVNQAKAQQRLVRLQEKLQRDRQGGNPAAVDRDVLWLDRTRYRMAVNCWLIRKNSLLDPGYYPIRTDEMSAFYINQVASPPQGFPVSRLATDPGPQAAAPTIPITIVNAEAAGPGVDFAIDGVGHQATGGSRQDLAVAPTALISYDGGGLIGQRQYQVEQGLYEFRSTGGGWALYKLPTPAQDNAKPAAEVAGAADAANLKTVK